MWSWAVVFGLAGGLGLALAISPSQDEAVRRCLAGCDAPASKTDRETCRLQCRQQSGTTDAPIKHWKRTELKGGSPDPTVEGGSTTTTIERGPDGTTTTVTKTDRHGRTTVTTRHETNAGTARRGAQNGGVPFSLARRLHAWCHLGCSAHPRASQRAACRARCAPPRTVERPTPPAPPRKPAKKKASSKPDPSSCRARCTDTGRRCVDACPSRSSDRATCELQCDEGAAACRRRCG